MYYHWINYKREGSEDYQDHWHHDRSMADGYHYRMIEFRNDVNLPAGKGYLMALSSESMMMADGTLNNGLVEHNVFNSQDGLNVIGGQGQYHYDAPYRSFNLIGNPYQSYLDFYELVFNSEVGENNQGILYSYDDDDNKTYYSYALRDDNDPENPYIYHTVTQSENEPYSAGRYIHPHQAFFVKAKANGTLQITDAMRSVAGSSSNGFRYEQVNYPLVNLLCYDDSGNRDLTTIEVNRPELGGGAKMDLLHSSKGLIYAHLENESYQTLFTPEGVTTVPVRFVPAEDGVFTLNWNTRHGEFSYLHLIDNLTGVDVDCLANEEYRFESKTSDYKSRFKLVFRCEGEGPDDPEGPDNNDTDHFAFMFGEELVVNGEGAFYMFDVSGRCLVSTQLSGAQTNLSLPKVAAGIYVLQLTNNSQTKVQKMVIK